MFTEQYMGNITLWGSYRIPYGWQVCEGQLLSIADYTQLFGLLGIAYGGDGISDFALPDLRARIAVHAGRVPGLTNSNVLGQTGGSLLVHFTAANLASHTHNLIASKTDSTIPISCYSQPGYVNSPINSFPAETSTPLYADTANETIICTATGTTPLNEKTLQYIPSSPYSVLNYIICVKGLYPNRP